MKSLLLAAAVTLTSASSFADGFLCSTEAQDLKVRVFNQVQPEAGTRNAAIMILSNPKLSLGRRTIAKFHSESLLSNLGADYSAKVDLRYTDSGRKGELIAGTKLGYVARIDLAVDFTYAQPLIAGSVVDGLLTVTKRDGDQVQVLMECERYLKN